MEKERGIIIVGAGKPDITELAKLHPDCKIVTAEEAMQIATNGEVSYPYKAQKPMVEPMVVKNLNYKKPLSNRAARRKAERDRRKG